MVSGRNWHKERLFFMISSARHFAQELEAKGFQVQYLKAETTIAGLDKAQKSLGNKVPIVCAEPSSIKQYEQLEAHGVSFVSNDFFLTPRDLFRDWASKQKSFVMENFYRAQRVRLGILVDGEGKPEQGRWNFDAENRGAFPRTGPGPLPAPRRFAPDSVTRGVIDLVNTRFATHPGSLATFDWPVTSEEAHAALDDFLLHRLASFGKYQDAIWTGEPWLYHSRLSAAMNLKLLDPRDVVAGAERAWREGNVPLESAEGFIRQVIGWREYVRGVYWHLMPEYESRNALGASLPLPAFYWTAATEMNCLRDALSQTLTHGYAHHIQRLMVTGLFAMLAGVRPEEVHRWYLAVYVDAVEWVELPNTLGMSQFADGGVMASKPYCASGAYIERMSNACRGCRFEPKKATGPEACPFTTLYWDFLARHAALLKANPRMTMQLKNLDRKDAAEMRTIRRQADEFRAGLG